MVAWMRMTVVQVVKNVRFWMYFKNRIWMEHSSRVFSLRNWKDGITDALKHCKAPSTWPIDWFPQLPDLLPAGALWPTLRPLWKLTSIEGKSLAKGYTPLLAVCTQRVINMGIGRETHRMPSPSNDDSEDPFQLQNFLWDQLRPLLKVCLSSASTFAQYILSFPHSHWYWD